MPQVLPPEHGTRGGFYRRWLAFVVGGVLTLGFIGVWLRLVQLHVIAAPELREMLARQAYVRLQLLPMRGSILDRRGELLAQSVQGVSYGVDPAMVQCLDCLCQRAEAVLGIPAEQCRKLVRTARTRFVWLRRGVWGQPTQALDTLREPGLVRIPERVRVYPQGELFVPVLGSVGVDQQGLSGLELAYDSLLRAEPVTVLMRRDARGHLVPPVEQIVRQPAAPPTLQTTLDGELQRIVAYELAQGVEQAGASSGIAVVIEPATGALRAVAAVPTPPRGSAHAPVVGDVYEPGSVFKPIIAAAALEQRLVHPDDVLDGRGGVWDIGGHRIVDERPLEYMTLRQALAYSSNIAFAELAQRLPRHVLYRSVRDFGFGMPTGVELPGEAAGIVPKLERFEPSTPLFWGFGYGLAATPLQIACAYAAIANDGVLMRPRLVEALLDAERGRLIRSFPPQQIRRVISVQTARQLRRLLTAVVEEGTGRAARVPGLSIAGKTGTAQQLVDGQYSRQAHTASFVAMVPAEQPRIVVLVMVVRPQRGSSGGQVAAPIVRRILQRMAAHPELSSFLRGSGTGSSGRSSLQAGKNGGTGWLD